MGLGSARNVASVRAGAGTLGHWQSKQVGLEQKGLA